MPESLRFLETHSTWIAVSVLILLLGWESFHPFFQFFRGKTKQRITHFLRNAILGMVNIGITSLVFVLLWKWATDWTAKTGFGLLHWVSWPGWLEMIVAILLLDFWTYWWHRLNHRIPFLWRFHSVHHTDPKMDVTTASRFHFGEIILSSILRIPVLLLIGAEIWQLAIYEAMLFAVVQFHHANIVLPDWLDRFLRIVIVTPAMHKIHHSRIQKETDSNYTSLFSWSDRVFGSFRLREGQEDMRGINFGLDDHDSAEKQSVWGMLKTPFDSRRTSEKENQ